MERRGVSHLPLQLPSFRRPPTPAAAAAAAVSLSLSLSLTPACMPRMHASCHAPLLLLSIRSLACMRETCSSLLSDGCTRQAFAFTRTPGVQVSCSFSLSPCLSLPVSPTLEPAITRSLQLLRLSTWVSPLEGSHLCDIGASRDPR